MTPDLERDATLTLLVRLGIGWAIACVGALYFASEPLKGPIALAIYAGSLIIGGRWEDWKQRNGLGDAR